MAPKQKTEVTLVSQGWALFASFVGYIARYAPSSTCKNHLSPATPALTFFVEWGLNYGLKNRQAKAKR